MAFANPFLSLSSPLECCILCKADRVLCRSCGHDPRPGPLLCHIWRTCRHAPPSELRIRQELDHSTCGSCSRGTIPGCLRTGPDPVHADVLGFCHRTATFS